VIELDGRKIFTGSTTCPSLVKYFVARMLTRDLFTVAKLLVVLMQKKRFRYLNSERTKRLCFWSLVLLAALNYTVHYTPLIGGMFTPRNTPLPDNNFYPRDVVSAVYATATWVAGWVGVCLAQPVCIKMTKPILKHFQPSGSPII